MFTGSGRRCDQRRGSGQTRLGAWVGLAALVPPSVLPALHLSRDGTSGFAPDPGKQSAASHGGLPPGSGDAVGGESGGCLTCPGFLDASTAIVPLDRPTGVVDPWTGDVHPGGCPHDLFDPLRVFAVTGRMADNLAALSPAGAPAFASRLG